MKYLCPFIFISSIVFCSCFKAETYQQQPFNYTLDSIADVVLAINDSAQITINATLESGSAINQPITLTVSGLPYKVMANHTDTVFGLNCNFAITLNAENAIPGTYHIQVTESSIPLGKRTHNLLLIITPCRDRASLLTGKYYWSSGFPTFPDSINSTISDMFDKPNRIFIPNIIHGSHQLLYADIICGTNNLNIPLQSANGYQIYGKGTFSIMTNSYDYITSIGIGLQDTFVKATDTNYWSGACSKEN
jgi:hypothetical protein